MFAGGGPMSLAGLETPCWACWLVWHIFAVRTSLQVLLCYVAVGWANIPGMPAGENKK